MILFVREFISAIQQSVNKDTFKIQHYESYDEIGDVYSGEILVKLTKTNGKNDTIYDIRNYEIKKDYIAAWKQTAPGKFLRSDYIKEVKDSKGLIPYYYVTFIKNDITYQCLLRNLFEVNDNILDEEQKNNYISCFGDVKIEDKYYSVIKIANNKFEKCWSLKDAFNDKSDANNLLLDMTSIIDNVNEEEEEEENPNMEKLF